jgi:hypothetical protein
VRLRRGFHSLRRARECLRGEWLAPRANELREKLTPPHAEGLRIGRQAPWARLEAFRFLALDIHRLKARTFLEQEHARLFANRFASSPTELGVPA